MQEPWYKGYFSPAFWQLARAEYTAERTEKELRYLRSVLGALDGLRVLDLGCGTGRHALALAPAGAIVTGMDVAREHAAGLGPSVRFIVADALLDHEWPEEEFDAIVCIQSIGWGSEADQRRLFRNCRRHLTARGVFVLDHSNVYQIARRFAPAASCEIDGVRFNFERAFDLLTGRNQGALTATAPGTPPMRMAHDFQLYPTHALISELQRAGFDVQRVDADFEVGSAVSLDSRYIQLVATPAGRAPMSLAIHTHKEREAPAPEPVLDLMWAPDEVESLTKSLEDVLGECLQSQGGLVASGMRHYALSDPYGAQRSRPVLEHFFAASLPEDSITFGAGITSLLRQLAPLADGGPVVCFELSYPDYAAWACEYGSQTHYVSVAERVSAAYRGSIVQCGSGREQTSTELESTDAAARLLDAALASHAGVVLIERPSVFGERISLDVLGRLATKLRCIGAVLLIDEAYHAYFAGFDSAASLVAGHGNVIVLRSFSKGYCCGGLRLGFALAGKQAAVRVRELVAPLQVAELSFQLGLRLLEAGDIFHQLRARVTECKRHVLRSLPLDAAQIFKGDESLPWIVLHDPSDKLRAAFKECGILVKPIITGHSPYLRMSIPLSPARLEAFDTKMERLRAIVRAH